MTIEEKVITVPVEEVAADPVAPNSLGNKAAMEHAINQNRAEPAPVIESEAPTAREVKAAVDVDPEPPSEFGSKGREAWKNKDIRGIQEEYQRINTSRTQEMGRAQSAEKQAREEAKKSKEFLDSVSPYIEDRLIKDGVSKPEAAAQAIRLAHALRTDKKAAIIELRKLGFKIADEDGAAPNVPDEKINTLQTRLDALEQKEKQVEYKNLVSSFHTGFETLGALKNRTGDPVLPDLHRKGEDGEKVAAEIGSLCKQPLFRELVLRRFPAADLTRMMYEAYVQLNYRVAGDPHSKESSKNNQEQIKKQQRAAASSPGGSVSRSGSESLIGKLGNRAALKKAIELNQEH